MMTISYDQALSTDVYELSYSPKPRPNLCREPRKAPEHELKTGCCGPCSSKPPRDQRGQSGETVRVNVDYSIQGCCGQSPPFIPYDMENIPYQLYNAGVTDQEWTEFVKRLVQVNSMRKGACRIQCLLRCLSLIFLPCLIPSACQSCAREIAAWDKELRKWQDDFNNEVLIRQGCFVKTKSNCWVTYNQKGEKQRHIDRWIAFALTPAESELLKYEPHITGDIEKGCCGGVNEETCCIHPN